MDRQSPAVAMSRYIAIFLCILHITCYGNGEVVPPKVTMNDGYEIPAIGLGTWLGSNTKSREGPGSIEVEQAIVWGVEAGYRHIDTAAMYEVEDQVGRGLARKIADGVPREELFLTTKLWNTHHAFSQVEPALRESLAKLQLDYVDLYLIHWPAGQFENNTYDYTDYLETWRGMIDVKQKGLAKSIGLSNFNQQMMERIQANGLEKPAVLQIELNLNLQQPELLAYCKQHNITVVGYTPFGSLFSSKSTEDVPPPRVDDPSLVTIANAHGKTVPQIALRYVLELGAIPIPKSVTKSRIEKNIDIFDFQLTEQEKNVLKSFDRNYRTLPQYHWMDHPYYPYEKKKIDLTKREIISFLNIFK